jgi:hypothetical protein
MEAYEERLICEYEQLNTRIKKLQLMLENWYRIDSETECTYEQLLNQLKAMEYYRSAIEFRADWRRLKNAH